jgi:2-amino-4-hydroxy-6-hydroxymethyldihydropteridine diphosphokinase
MDFSDVFLSLGGNIGDTKKVLLQALEEISKSEKIALVKSSSFYKTSPVSLIPQRYFINCACHIKTSLSPEMLLKTLETIETKLGKVPKGKQSPRIVDIDIIFFGSKYINNENLIIPHKEWKRRLFVLKPLCELTQMIVLSDENNNLYNFDLKEFLSNFENTNKETVTIINN